MRTQLNALVNNGRLTTTEAKAKMVKPLFDKLVTRAKKASVASRRLLAKDLASSTSANRLVDVIAPLFPDRVSGYTSSTKNKIRRGDAVTMVTLKLMAELPAPIKPTSPASHESSGSRKSDSSVKTTTKTKK